MGDIIGLIIIFGIILCAVLLFIRFLRHYNPDADKCEHGVAVTMDKPCSQCANNAD